SYDDAISEIRRRRDSGRCGAVVDRTGRRAIESVRGANRSAFAGLDRRSAKAGIANLRVRGTVQQQRLQRGRGVCDEGRQTHTPSIQHVDGEYWSGRPGDWQSIRLPLAVPLERVPSASPLRKLRRLPSLDGRRLCNLEGVE